MGVGCRLRQAREARGLSTTEVAERTKVPAWQLAALEAEQYERLPGGIFVKGHIRATATVVGLDPVELSADFDEEISPPPPPVRVPMGELDDDRPRLRMAIETPEPRSQPTGRLLVAGLIVISIVLAIVWFGRDRGAPPASRLKTPAPAQLASDATSALAPPAPVAIGTIGVIRARMPDAGIPVSIEAQRVCWLRLTVDGQRVAHRMLQRGEKVSAHMRRQATVRTGDAGALMMSIGNGPARALGAPGAVRTIELTPEDYLRASR
jgi:cytoskeletal protein RodZ